MCVLYDPPPTDRRGTVLSDVNAVLPDPNTEDQAVVNGMNLWVKNIVRLSSFGVIQTVKHG